MPSTTSIIWKAREWFPGSVLRPVTPFRGIAGIRGRVLKMAALYGENDFQPPKKINKFTI